MKKKTLFDSSYGVHLFSSPCKISR